MLIQLSNLVKSFIPSKLALVLFIIVLFLLLVIGIGINKYKHLSEFSQYQGQNLASYAHNSELWRNNYGQLVITSAVKLSSLREAKTTSDSITKRLIAENKLLGNKLKRTEYIIGLHANMNIDTVVNVMTIVVNDTLFKELDSLTIASFKLTRIKLSNETTAHYNIEYHPELYLSINWYKEGKWKFKNIFKPRQHIYEVDLRVNDDILKPSRLDVVKFSKR